MYADGAVNRLVDYYFDYLNKSSEFDAYILAEKYQNTVNRKNQNHKGFIEYKCRPGRLRNYSIIVSIFLKLLFTKRPDIIHLHQLGIELIPLILYSKLFKVKLIITNHITSFEGEYRNKYYEYKVPYDIITKSLFIRKNNYLKHYKNVVFIGTSKESIEELKLKGFSFRNYEYIPNGVQAIEKVEKSYIDKVKTNIIWVGRYDVQKNLTLLLEVALKLKELNVNFSINVYGLLEKNLDDYDRKLYSGISDYVKLNGYSENLNEEIRKSDIGLFTSLFEAMSLAMLDMLNNGVPVVSTPVSGMREVLEEYNCGIVCNSFDPEEIAAALLKLILDRDVYLIKSANARNAIKNKFNIKDNIVKHIQLYKKLINY